MTTTSKRWRVPPWAYPWLAAAISAEATSNALRAYGLGAHLDQFTLRVADSQVSIAGAVLVLAAIAVTGSQARAAWVALTPTSPVRQRLVAGLAAGLLLSVSVSAMISHLFEAQRAKIADEGGDRGRHDRAKAAYDKLRADDDALQLPIPPRSAAEIQADVASVKIDMRIWRASKQCQDITRDESKVACAPVLALYKERARAARRTELAPELDRAKAALDAVPRPAETTAAEAGAAGLWGWLMGCAVVFLATFGSVLFAKVDAELSGGPDSLGERSDRNWLQTDFVPAVLARHGRGDGLEPSVGGPTSGLRLPLKPNSSARARCHRDEVLAGLQRQLAAGEQFDSQDRLSELFGIPKSTLSEWLSGWEAAGKIPARRANGRRKMIAIVPV